MGEKNADGSILKIAITGPESSGKTALCKFLAGKFHTEWVPEFARDYLEQRNGKYTYEDLAFIADRQLEAESSQLEKAHAFLFCDSELINIKIWSEYRFGKVDATIVNHIIRADYALYLVCKPDIPWEPDPLRENPDDRDLLFDRFIKELTYYKKRFEIVSGEGTEREEMAYSYIIRNFPGKVVSDLV